jgi:acetyl esterase/lipase
VLSAIELTQLELPQPAGSVLISPWMDMSLRAYQGGNAHVESDFLVTANNFVPIVTSMFLGGLSGTSPDVNPLFRSADEIRKLKPQLILVGGAEFALQDSKEWAALCEKANVRHELVVEWGQLHVYALGSKFVDPHVRGKTDAKIVGWIKHCLD